jgi:ubiquinone/menaquinone biosynthesis C-methylase UbiE
MRKQKMNPGADGRQREGMRRWGRRNARYYHLWSTLLSAAGYRRMVEEVALGLPEHGTAVDIGCGNGEWIRIALRRRPELEIVACDLAPEFLAIAGRRHPSVRRICADAEQIPLRSSAADEAVSLGVLGHLLVADRAIEELARITRPGGRVVVWTRVDGPASRLIARLFGWANPGVAFRLHPIASIRAMLTRAGVRIERERSVAGGRLWIGTRDQR